MISTSRLDWIHDSYRYTLRAWAYFKLGRAEAGLPDADRAITLQPMLTSAYVATRGNILEALGRADEAILDYRKALTLAPAVQEANDGLGRIAKASGNANVKQLDTQSARRDEEMRKAMVETRMAQDRLKAVEMRSLADQKVAERVVQERRAQEAKRDEEMRQVMLELRRTQESLRAAEEQRLASLKADEALRARTAAEEANRRTGELAQAIRGELKRVGCDAGVGQVGWDADRPGVVA